MTTTGQQPEALVFANDRPTNLGDNLYQWAMDAEALIRAQHARIAELESQREAIGAGGVEQEAAPQAVQAAVPEAIEQMAVDRYKVVPSHESMFHRWAVVAGNGAQQLYIGREGECQNMARKFMGAFLDGAFVAMQNATTSPRRLAMATGAKTYQPDGPCRYGHVAPRYTSGKQCLACVAERRKPSSPPPDDALLAMLTAHPGCTALELSVLLQRDDGDTLLALGSLQRLSLAKMRKGRWYAGRVLGAAKSSRAQAVAEGRTTYNTGKPCKYGHLCDRFVSGNACVECNRLREAKRPPRVQRDRPRARSGFALQNHWMR